MAVDIQDFVDQMNHVRARILRTVIPATQEIAEVYTMKEAEAKAYDAAGRPTTFTAGTYPIMEAEVAARAGESAPPTMDSLCTVILAKSAANRLQLAPAVNAAYEKYRGRITDPSFQSNAQAVYDSTYAANASTPEPRRTKLAEAAENQLYLNEVTAFEAELSAIVNG